MLHLVQHDNRGNNKYNELKIDIIKMRINNIKNLKVLKTFLRKQESNMIMWIPAFAGMMIRIVKSYYFFYYFFFCHKQGTERIM